VAEYIEDPEIVKELEEIFDEFAQELADHTDHIEVNTDLKEYPSDIEAALRKTKPGETLFIFESENDEKWLIPAKSEEGALEYIRNLVKKKGRRSDEG
jgi:hypothetical protein